MTLTDLQQKLRDRIRSAAREKFSVEVQQLSAEARERANSAEKFSERIARLQRQRDEIDRAIAELAHARKIIDGMLATRERSVERV